MGTEKKKTDSHHKRLFHYISLTHIAALRLDPSCATKVKDLPGLVKPTMTCQSRIEKYQKDCVDHHSGPLDTIKVRYRVPQLNKDEHTEKSRCCDSWRFFQHTNKCIWEQIRGKNSHINSTSWACSYPRIIYIGGRYLFLCVTVDLALKTWQFVVWDAAAQDKKNKWMSSFVKTYVV